MNFVGVESPSDVVGMNPDFIREEGQRLASLITALCADSGAPLGSAVDGKIKIASVNVPRKTAEYRMELRNFIFPPSGSLRCTS